MEALAHRISILLQTLHLVVPDGADVAQALQYVIVERLVSRWRRFLHRILQGMRHATGVRCGSVNFAPITFLQRAFHPPAECLQVAKRGVDEQQPAIQISRLRQSLDRTRNSAVHAARL